MHSLLIFENYPLAPECSPLLLDSGTLPLFCFLLFLLCLVCCYKDPEVDILSQDKDAVFCHLNSRREQGRDDPTCETLVLSLPGTPPPNIVFLKRGAGTGHCWVCPVHTVIP